MAFADSPATRNALAAHGIRATGFRWKWGLGLKGGTYPPHRSLNGQVGGNENAFDGRLPGSDVNGDTCMCWLVPVYRDALGRIAKATLEPAFIPPVIASTGKELELHVPTSHPVPMSQKWDVGGEPVPISRSSTYFAGVAGTVKIPEGFRIVGISCECTRTAGWAQIGAGPKIPIPEDTAFDDVFDDAPINAPTVKFTGTAAFYVRVVAA